MEPDRMTQVLQDAQARLRSALQRGSSELLPGLDAWDRAVTAINHLSAALTHVRRAELEALSALDALERWTRAGAVSETATLEDA